MHQRSTTAVLGLLLAGLTAAGCTTGHATAVTPSVVATAEPTATPGAEAVPDETAALPTGHPIWVIGELCHEHCEDLLGAAEQPCPPPEEDISGCMVYLSELYEAVAEVDARVSEMDEDHGELLSATRQALALAQEFALAGCHRVTARVDAHSAECGDRASALRSAAAAVGALLQRALTG